MAEHSNLRYRQIHRLMGPTPILCVILKFIFDIKFNSASTAVACVYVGFTTSAHLIQEGTNLFASSLQVCTLDSMALRAGIWEVDRPWTAGYVRKGDQT